MNRAVVVPDPENDRGHLVVDAAGQVVARGHLVLGVPGLWEGPAGSAPRKDSVFFIEASEQ